MNYDMIRLPAHPFLTAPELKIADRLFRSMFRIICPLSVLILNANHDDEIKYSKEKRLLQKRCEIHFLNL